MLRRFKFQSRTYFFSRALSSVMSLPVGSIPQRRSLLLFAMLAIVMVVFSYLFTLLLAVACVYLPWLAVSNLPNFQTFALLLGGIVVAGVMFWSLVPRPDKFEAPGVLLQPASHPRLFAEIENIAASLREPVPREIYLISDPNAWVADRGGLMGFGSRRVMGLGLPLLAALNISQFRAILAHEFAHYYGGDTSLGPWVHRKRRVSFFADDQARLFQPGERHIDLSRVQSAARTEAFIHRRRSPRGGGRVVDGVRPEIEQ